MRHSLIYLLTSVALAGGWLPVPAQAAVAGDLLSQYARHAGAEPSASRGQQFFNARQGRECTTLEKADVMAWLIGLKP